MIATAIAAAAACRAARAIIIVAIKGAAIGTVVAEEAVIIAVHAFPSAHAAFVHAMFCVLSLAKSIAARYFVSAAA